MNIIATMTRRTGPGSVQRQITFGAGYDGNTATVQQEGCHVFKDGVGMCYVWDNARFYSTNLFSRSVNGDVLEQVSDLLRDCRKLMAAWDSQYDEVIQEHDFSEEHQLSIRRLKFLGKYFGE